MATLTVTTTTNYTGQSLNDIDQIVFATSGTATATFGSNQFGPGLIENDVAITGDPNQNIITVNLTAIGFFSAGLWTFSNWNAASDLVILNAFVGTNGLVGSSQRDHLNGGDDDDTLSGGAGDDIVNGGAGNDTLDGGTGNDFIGLGAGDDRVLFRVGGGADTISGMEVGGGNIDRDEIDISAFAGINSFADILARTTQQGADAVIDFGGGDTLTLQSVNKSALAATDFIGFEENLNDFTGEGRSDILWRHDNGTTNLFRMNGATVEGGSNISVQVDNSWSAQEKADFNGDDHADILWRHANGTANIFLMDGAAVIGGSNTSMQLPTTFTVQEAADFDGDGRADILWRSFGPPDHIRMFLMDGTTVLLDTQLSVQPSPDATVQGTGDFDRDGRADILFRAADGTANVFFMDGATVRFALNITQQVDNAWSVRAVNDFNGDGRADILWRHANGTSNIFLMDGANVLGGSNLSVQVDNAWSVQDTGDYNGDGKADILWRHQNGTSNIFLMDGAAVLGGSNISVQVDNGWHVV